MRGYPGVFLRAISLRSRPIVTSVSLDVHPQTNRQVVHNFDERYERESYEQTEYTSHAGQEVHAAV